MFSIIGMRRSLWKPRLWGLGGCFLSVLQKMEQKKEEERKTRSGCKFLGWKDAGK